MRTVVAQIEEATGCSVAGALAHDDGIEALLSKISVTTPASTAADGASTDTAAGAKKAETNGVASSPTSRSSSSSSGSSTSVAVSALEAELAAARAEVAQLKEDNAAMERQQRTAAEDASKGGGDGGDEDDGDGAVGTDDVRSKEVFGRG